MRRRVESSTRPRAWPRPSRRAVAATVLLLAVAGAACSGGDGGDDDADGSGGTEEAAPAVRFCDAYLDYLGEPTPANLAVVVDAADDPEVDELAAVVGEDDRTGRVLAASADLDDLARDRCLPEWVGGAQGAGDTGAAAQAFFDAVVAGDRIGARNVASANAIARFEPWQPIEADDDAGTPAIVSVGEGAFAMALGPALLAECQVETGVVLACTVVR